MTRHTTKRSRGHQLMRAGATPSLVVLAVVAIAACSGYASSVPPAASPSQAGSLAPVTQTNGSTAVEMRDFAFDPATLTVPSGSKVTWTNSDTTAHTVTFDDASTDSGPLDPLSIFDHTFTTAGTFSYHCNIHSFMHGTVAVTP